MPSVSNRSSRARIFSVAAALVMLAGLFPAAVGAVAPSGAPTLLNPGSGDTVSSNPIFSWTAVTGAAKYRVQISTEFDMAPLVYNVDTVNRKATPPADLPLGLLYWRVAGTDGSSGVGPYSPVGTFTKEWGTAPVIDAPADGDSFDFPTEPVLFDWQPLAGAKSYTLEIDSDDQFILPTTHTTNNTNFTLTEPPTDRPDVLLAAPGNFLDGRRRQRVDDHAPVHLRLANRSCPSDAAGRRRHADPGHHVQLVAGRRRQDVPDPSQRKRRMGQQPSRRHRSSRARSTTPRLTSTMVPTSGESARRTPRAPPTTGAGRPSGSSLATGRSTRTRSPRSTTAALHPSSGCPRWSGPPCRSPPITRCGSATTSSSRRARTTSVIRTARS